MKNVRISVKKTRLGVVKYDGYTSGLNVPPDWHKKPCQYYQYVGRFESREAAQQAVLDFIASGKRPDIINPQQLPIGERRASIYQRDYGFSVIGRFRDEARLHQVIIGTRKTMEEAETIKKLWLETGERSVKPKVHKLAQSQKKVWKPRAAAHSAWKKPTIVVPRVDPKEERKAMLMRLWASGS